MKTLSDGQRGALSLAAAVLCGVGTMFVPEVQLEAGQEVTVGHVIAMGASLALKVAVIPLLGAGLVYGAMHLAHNRRLAGEGGQTGGDTGPGSAIEPDALDGLLIQATLDGDLHWVWLPSENYWMAARQPQNTVSAHPAVAPDGSVRLSGFYGLGRLPTRDTALDRWAVAVKERAPGLEEIAAEGRPETVDFVRAREVKRACYWPKGTASVHPDPDAVACVSPGWSGTPEARAVVAYMKAGWSALLGLGYAQCRLCPDQPSGATLDEVGRRNMPPLIGSADLIGPDGKWMYPQGWEHYIEVHSVRPWDEVFIADAVRWHNSPR